MSPRTFFPIIVVRFSAFGDLVTMTRTDDYDPAAFENLIAALGDAGFVYVPADELQERYTGRNPHIGDQSWWIRFFDYL